MEYRGFIGVTYPQDRRVEQLDDESRDGLFHTQVARSGEVGARSRTPRFGPASQHTEHTERYRPLPCRKRSAEGPGESELEGRGRRGTENRPHSPPSAGGDDTLCRFDRGE